MFKTEINKKEPMISNCSLLESISEFHSLIIENQLELSMAINSNNQTIDKILENNDGKYSDDINEILSKSALDILVNSKNILTDAKNSLYKVYGSLSGVLGSLSERTNKAIIDYSPMLKKINTSKYTYKIPKYDLGAFNVQNMVESVMKYLNTFPSINRNIFIDSDLDYNRILNNDFKDMDNIILNVKKSLFGINKNSVNTINVYSILCKSIYDTDRVETMSFSEDIYNKMRAVVNYTTYNIDINYINDIILSELRIISSYIDSILSDKEGHMNRDAFYDNTSAKKLSCRVFIITSAITGIVDMIQFKINAVNEIVSIYIKVLSDVYATCSEIKSYETPMLEAFNPFVGLQTGFDLYTNDIY